MRICLEYFPLFLLSQLVLKLMLGVWSCVTQLSVAHYLLCLGSLSSPKAPQGLVLPLAKS